MAFLKKKTSQGSFSLFVYRARVFLAVKQLVRWLLGFFGDQG